MLCGTHLLCTLVHYIPGRGSITDTESIIHVMLFLHMRMSLLPCLFSLASVLHGPLGNVTRGVSRRNGLASELADDAGVRSGHGAGVTEGVELAGAAEDGGTLLVGVGVRGAEELAADGGLYHSVDVLEDITLGQDVTTSADLEGVAIEVVEEVVHLSA